MGWLLWLELLFMVKKRKKLFRFWYDSKKKCIFDEFYRVAVATLRKSEAAPLRHE